MELECEEGLRKPCRHEAKPGSLAHPPSPLLSHPLASADRQDLDVHRLHPELCLHERGHQVQEFPVSPGDSLQGQQ